MEGAVSGGGKKSSKRARKNSGEEKNERKRVKEALSLLKTKIKGAITECRAIFEAI